MKKQAKIKNELVQVFSACTCPITLDKNLPSFEAWEAR